MIHRTRETERPSATISATDLLACVGWMALGASIMYILDPVGGGRRRSLVRDKFAHGVHRAANTARGTAIQVRNRTTGFAHEVRARWMEGHVDDVTLVERVRSQMGRVVTHPAAIVVRALDGEVTVSGPILADEVDDLLANVRSVRGVTSVCNELDVYETASDIPALQGQGSRQNPG
jgi:hypothetical protein